MQVVSDNKPSNTKKDNVCKKPYMLHSSTYRQRWVEQNVQQYQNLKRNTSHTAPHSLQWKILSCNLTDPKYHLEETGPALCLYEVQVLDRWMDWWAFVLCEKLSWSWGVMQRNWLPKTSTLKWSTAVYCPISRKEARTLLKCDHKALNLWF